MKRNSFCGRPPPALSLLLVVGLLIAPGFAAAQQGQQCEAKANLAPDNQTVNEGVVVTLNGQPSQPNNASLLWRQIAGPAVTLSSTTAVKPIFTAPLVGPSGVTLTFRLTVTACSPSQTAAVTTNIMVEDVAPLNDAPIAAASVSPSPVREGDTVLLDGNASSDPDGDPLTFLWTQIGGTAVALMDANTAVASFLAPNTAFPNGQSFTFKLTVSDGSLSAMTEAIVNVEWENDPPVAVVSCPQMADEGADITLNGRTSSDPDDGIASYAWTQIMGPPTVDPGQLAAMTETITFQAPSLGFMNDGFLPFRLTVTDVGGLQDATGDTDCVVQIKDITPPVIAPHADVTAEATGPAGAAVAYTAPATSDLVDGPGTAMCLPASGSVFALGSTAVTCTASDTAGNPAVPTGFTVNVVDTTPPVIAPHADVAATATGGSVAIVNYDPPTAVDLVDGPVTVNCTPDSGVSFPVGSTTVTCSASDTRGNAGSRTFVVRVSFDFEGFFAPVDNLPVVNKAKAGSAIPVRFSLNGDQGLNILATGYPKSVVMACSAGLQAEMEETVAAGASSLSYDPITDQYVYVWKSTKAWAGTCRQLQIRLTDGSERVADFSFAK
jgi:hypothetical protein